MHSIGVSLIILKADDCPSHTQNFKSSSFKTNHLRNLLSQPKATSQKQSILAKADRDKKTINKKVKKVSNHKA